MPRWPHRSRKNRSVSPSRVPPDQSGTVVPAATSARSGSRTRIARVRWVSRVPSVNISTRPRVAPADTAWVNRCASRSSASAYPLIEPDTSIRSTTRRGRVPRRRQAMSPGSPIRRRLPRRVREASMSPRCQGWCRAVRRIGGRGRSVANIAASRCFSAASARRRRGAGAPRRRWPSPAPRPRARHRRRCRPRTSAARFRAGRGGRTGRGRGSPSRPLKYASKTWS